MFALLLAACEPVSDKKAKPEDEPEPSEDIALEPEPGLPDVMLTPVEFSELPGWDGDVVAEALPALRRSCERLLTRDDDRPVGPQAVAGTVADWRAPCDALKEVADGDESTLREVLRAEFAPFAVAGPEGDKGLFTGYYEATLNAAPFPGGDYRYPLYRRPDDLVSVNLGNFRADLRGERLVGRVENGEMVPYYSRGEIEAGRLDGRNLELFWADDPVDVFFLHVQGSGIVKLPNGDEQRVGFAASNGRDFTAIGRELIRSGEMDSDDMSMQGIRDWLRANPERASELMRRNARYIFFRIIDGEGPIGAQGVALTPGRSLAVDPGRLPLGAPMWLDTTYPASGEPLRRLMVAQDTGKAIKGTVRGDFFWGPGEEALEYAGRMKQTGRYWLFLPRAVAERRQLAS